MINKEGREYICSARPIVHSQRSSGDAGLGKQGKARQGAPESAGGGAWKAGAGGPGPSVVDVELVVNAVCVVGMLVPDSSIECCLVLL